MSTSRRKSLGRIAGKPNEKLKLLSKLDQTTLPHLVADILYFQLGHRNVHVVDGPGDGKRDIDSVRPDSIQHLAQCKYHEEVNSSINPDELSELILALVKFKYSSGLFVTTGKITPQAKREFLSDYPAYDLNFLDGSELVDAILASPILSSVWFDGTNIIQARSVLVVPLILRSIQNDRPIGFLLANDSEFQGQEFSIRRATHRFTDFSPYRAPITKTLSEENREWLNCLEAICVNPINIHQIPQQLELIATEIARSLPSEELPVTIRFGVPSLTSNIELLDDDRVKLQTLEPQSFVVTRDRHVLFERDYAMVNKLEGWQFPENLSVAEEPWAGWLNRSKNCVFMQELRWPTSGSDFFQESIRKARERFLQQSLFLAASESNYEHWMPQLSAENRPDWQCSYGPNGVLIGWLHPALDPDELSHLVLRYDAKQDQYEVHWRGEEAIPDFESKINSLRNELQEKGFISKSAEQAKHIAAADGVDLLSIVEERIIYSAELVHYFDDIPSPIYLRARNFLYVQMWRIPVPPEEAHPLLNGTIWNLQESIKLYWEVKRGRESGDTFVMTSLIFACPFDSSALAFFDDIEPIRNDSLGKVALGLKALWPTIELATEFFWRTEVGFKIDDKQFQGNPWIILGGRKIRIETQAQET